MFKVRTLENFSYNEDGTEKGQGGKLVFPFVLNQSVYLVRDKAKEICELLNDT